MGLTVYLLNMMIFHSKLYYQRVKTPVSKSTRLIPFFSAGDHPNNQLFGGTIQVGKEWTAEQAEQDQEQQNYGCSMLWSSIKEWESL